MAANGVFEAGARLRLAISLFDNLDTTLCSPSNHSRRVLPPAPLIYVIIKPMEDARLMEFFESLSREIAEIKTDLSREIAETKTDLTARLNGMDRRLERLENTTSSMLMQLAGINRSLTVAERLDATLTVTQNAQQRAFDDLAARVTRIERQLNLE